jgi:Na+:H+ antiporter, NhaA family
VSRPPELPSTPGLTGPERAFPHGLVRGVRSFVHIEAAGGVVLLVATIAALIWANGPAAASYDSFWHAKVTLVSVGDIELVDTLGHWVNDGLMVIFFFVIGLEIKAELVAGELQDRRRAAVPILAAVGGMIVPALFYVAVNLGGGGVSGWGIPMATDIAFALGVLAVLGARVPASLKVFLLTLAVVDDVGAILVIAAVYTDDMSIVWLGVAGALLAGIVVLRRMGVWYTPVYVVAGAGVWLATLQSGVHATIAGVVLGVMTPAIALRDRKPNLDGRHETLDEVRHAIFHVRETVPVTERLITTLHPVSSFVILPIFALANAGIPITRDGLASAAQSPVTIGIVVGLVIGKIVGIVLAAWLATRFGVGVLPPEMTWRHVTGVAALAGIGFTVAIFISGLAFEDQGIVEEAKLGVITASVIAAVLGAVLLGRRRSDADPPRPVPAGR